VATCLRCGYDWTPRKENPKKCPSCQNPGWNTPRTRRRRVIVHEVITQECNPVPTSAESGSGSTNAEAESGLDRIKQARERAEKLLETING
jgi:hypothetical protein